MDGTPFHEDAWTREDGGGGISRVLQDGNVWEKAGVNVSVVYGSMPPTAYRAATERDIEISPDAGRVPFFAAGISSVMHPRNPHAPTMHFNYRCAPQPFVFRAARPCTRPSITGSRINPCAPAVQRVERDGPSAAADPAARPRCSEMLMTRCV